MLCDIRVPHRPINTVPAQYRLRRRRMDECARRCPRPLAGKAPLQFEDRGPPKETDRDARAARSTSTWWRTEAALRNVCADHRIYSPIGSESAPIIQFFDSIGWTRIAERSLQYFLDKQHDDGFMQNFGGYMLETQAALWSMGEHFRYNQDRDWLARSLPVEAAVDYLVRERKLNRQPRPQPRPAGAEDRRPRRRIRLFMLDGVRLPGPGARRRDGASHGP